MFVFHNYSEKEKERKRGKERKRKRSPQRKIFPRLSLIDKLPDPNIDFL
jgi:hypothetical protein